jgi:hypothetical protein
VILDVVDRGLFSVVANTGDGRRTACGSSSTSRSAASAARRRCSARLFRRPNFAPQVDLRLLDRSASYFAAKSRQLTAVVSWRTSAGERRSCTINHDLEIYRDLGFIEREVPDSGRQA